MLDVWYLVEHGYGGQSSATATRCKQQTKGEKRSNMKLKTSTGFSTRLVLHTTFEAHIMVIQGSQLGAHGINALTSDTPPGCTSALNY
jgi:hypothetical protein